MATSTISSFNLTNNGGFVCSTGCEYIDLAGGGGTGSDSGGGRISAGFSEFYNPGDHGIPAGALVQLTIDIVAGNTRTGGTYFYYDPASPNSAYYAISGTTFNSHVSGGNVE